LNTKNHDLKANENDLLQISAWPKNSIYPMLIADHWFSALQDPWSN